MFVYPPQRLEHLLCHIAKVAVCWAANALSAERCCNLTFTCPPKMHPDRMIDKDDGVCQSSTLFDQIPGAEAIDKPAVGRMNGLNRLPDFRLDRTCPARLEL